MDSLKNLAKTRRLPTKKDPHLHSAAHLLADELATKLHDRKHFGLYLKLSLTMSHDVLRKLCGDVLESRTTKTPGRLFSYLVKQYNDERKASSTTL